MDIMNATSFMNTTSFHPPALPDSTSLCATAWLSLRSSYTDTQLFFLAMFPALITYWFFGCAFLVLDAVLPHLVLSYKCQPQVKHDWALVRKVAGTVLLHQFTVYPVAALLMLPLALARISFAQELPSLSSVVPQFAFFSLFTEVEFYCIHRLFHSPFFYKRVHKVHHQVTAPFGFVALYFHWFESAFAIIEVVLPVVVYGGHLVMLIAWACTATWMIVLHHSGYELPFLPDTIPVLGFNSMCKQHDDHHRYFNYCFGVIGILDWLLGTEMPEKRRHSTDKAAK